VGETALPRRAREAFLDRADQAGRAVGDDQQRIGQAAPSYVLEELAAARRVLLAPWRQVEKYLMAVRQHTPGGQHRLARLPQMQPLGDAVDKQVDRTRTDRGWQTPRIPPTVVA